MRWTPTSEQHAIISHDTATHARILAGPGTGKSATIIKMMLEMSKDGGGRGKLLTFTRAATNELKDKRLFGNEWGVGDLPGGVVIHQK